MDIPVCKKHLIEAKRHYDDGKPGFVPNWTVHHGSSTTPGHKSINPMCARIQCVEIIKHASVSIENFAPTLRIQTSTITPFLLCQKLYQDMYQLFHPFTNCASFGAISKASTRFCHYSPNAHTVSEQLRTTVGSDTSIHPNDHICMLRSVHSGIFKALESNH